MARIAEELLLLLLDNASAQPEFDGVRRDRMLTAAVLLDLAHDCRIRPAVDGEPAEPGRLVALSAPAGPLGPAQDTALQLLVRRPLRPADAIAKLRRATPAALFWELEHHGLVQKVRLPGAWWRRRYSWPLTDRSRVAPMRDAMLAVLFDGEPPDPVTAAVISLLHAVDGWDGLLSLSDRGWEWVRNRASEIASASWVDEPDAELPEFNLAVTLAGIRHALQPS